MSYYPTEEQENVMFSSSKGNKGSRGSVLTSARSWEEELDDVVAQSDENINRLNSMENLKPKPILPSQKSPLAMAGGKGRAVSTSRTPSSTSASRMSSSTFGISLSNTDCDYPEVTTENKIGFLLRRTKLLHEKLKSSEKVNTDLQTASQATRNMVQQMVELQAADQKQIALLKSSMIAMKNQMDGLAHRELERENRENEAAKDRSNVMIEREMKEGDKESVNRTVGGEIFDKKIRDQKIQVETILRENANEVEKGGSKNDIEEYEKDKGENEKPEELGESGICSQSNTSLNAAEIDLIVRSVGIIIKKDLKFLRDERNLDKMCTTEQSRLLKNCSNRISDIEKNMKDKNLDEIGLIKKGIENAVHSIEGEIQRLIGDYSRVKGRQDSLEDNFHSIKSNLAIKERNNAEIQKKKFHSIALEISALSDVVGRKMNVFISRYDNTLSELSNKVLSQTDRCTNVEKCQDNINKQIQHSSLSNSEMVQKVLDLETKVDENFNQRKLDIRDVINERMIAAEMSLSHVKDQINGIKHSIEDYKTLNIEKIGHISESYKKMKSKINELTASVGSFSKIREAVEVLLLDLQMKQEGNVDKNGTVRHIETVISNLNTTTFPPSSTAISSSPSDVSTEDLKGKNISLSKGGMKACVDTSHIPIGLEDRILGKLRDELDVEMLRIQSELEEVVKSGWDDMESRHKLKTGDDDNRVGEVIQRLQGVVISMQMDQQGVIDKVTEVEVRCSNLELIETKKSNTERSIPLNKRNTLEHISRGDSEKSLISRALSPFISINPSEGNIVDQLNRNLDSTHTPHTMGSNSNNQSNQKPSQTSTNDYSTQVSKVGSNEKNHNINNNINFHNATDQMRKYDFNDYDSDNDNMNFSGIRVADSASLASPAEYED